jgi:hypothetical protein
LDEASGQPQDGRTDFDFEIGRWKVYHRRLTEWLKGSDAWEEFEGISVARKILGGLGVIDEITNQRPSGTVYGMTIRLFDSTTQEWSMYPASSVRATFAIPMVGRCAQGRYALYAYEPIDGQHILTRFLWLDITPSSYRWEQAFSADGGGTWETNWTQEHIRLPE